MYKLFNHQTNNSTCYHATSQQLRSLDRLITVGTPLLVCSDKASPSLRYWADGPTGKMSTKFWGVERKAKLGAWGAVLPPDILGRKVTVGWFSEELAAARARDAAVLAVMGPHQHMNWFVEEYSAGEVELAGRIMAARLKWEEQQRQQQQQQRQLETLPHQQQQQQQLASDRRLAGNETHQREQQMQQGHGQQAQQDQQLLACDGGVLGTEGEKLREQGEQQETQQQQQQQQQEMLQACVLDHSGKGGRPLGTNQDLDCCDPSIQQQQQQPGHLQQVTKVLKQIADTEAPGVLQKQQQQLHEDHDQQQQQHEEEQRQGQRQQKDEVGKKRQQAQDGEQQQQRGRPRRQLGNGKHEQQPESSVSEQRQHNAMRTVGKEHHQQQQVLKMRNGKFQVSVQARSPALALRTEPLKVTAPEEVAAMGVCPGGGMQRCEASPVTEAVGDPALAAGVLAQQPAVEGPSAAPPAAAADLEAAVGSNLHVTAPIVPCSPASAAAGANIGSSLERTAVMRPAPTSAAAPGTLPPGSSEHSAAVAARKEAPAPVAAVLVSPSLAAPRMTRAEWRLGPHPATIPWHQRVYEHVALTQRLREKAVGAWWRDCQLGEGSSGR